MAIEMKYFFVSLILLFSLFSSAQAELQPVPPLKSSVTDLTGSLSSEQILNIKRNLKALADTKGSQLAVLIVSTTTPEAIEDYSYRVVKKWKLGRKGVDDGVLLLIALKDRKMRIEVGDGLEGVVTDIMSGRIIREYIAPEFRRGSIYQGILAGTDKIIQLINGEKLPPPATSQGNSSSSEGEIFPFMIFGSAFLSMFLAPMLGRIITVSLITVVGAVFIWFTTLNLFLTIFAALLLAIFSMAFSAPRSSSYRDGGGYGGGFGGGGGFSGGGFSGGGGGFGGGGASGGW